MQQATAQTATPTETTQQQLSPQQALEQARALYRQKRYQDAAHICQQISEQLPDFAPVCLLMSDIHLETGNMERATRFANRAREQAPDEPYVQFQTLKIHMSQPGCDWSLVCEAMDPILAAAPDNAVFHMVKADALLELGRSEEALAAYNQALAIEPLPLIIERKAACLIALKRFEAARDLVQPLCNAPDATAQQHFLLGKALIRLDEPETAERHCLRATQLNPQHGDAWKHLAIFAGKRGEKETAVLHAYRAVQTTPQDIHAYLILARLLTDLKRLGEAERVLRQGLERQPQQTALQDALRDMLIRTGQNREAIQYIEATLKRDPDNLPMQHMLAAMQGRATDTAPADYVSRLFDQYAEHFEEHLQEGLAYRTPDKLASAIREVLVKQDRPTKGLSLLDLGCGTGLAAEALKAHTTQRIGIDLSEKMIERARQKDLYEQAEVADITAFMQRDTRRYDLIVSADVFVYIGRLEPVFQAARERLKPGGLLAFSVEDGDDAPPYTLRKTGRYAHAQAHIESLAAECGYTVQSCRQEELRRDQGKPIMGHLFILQAQQH